MNRQLSMPEIVVDGAGCAANVEACIIPIKGAAPVSGILRQGRPRKLIEAQETDFE